jgi:hypothetical protein
VSRRRPPVGRPSQSDGGYAARALARRLVDTREASGADSGVIISALSVVLGMVIANVAADREVVDIAIDTIHRAIAANDEDDPVERLQ